MLSKKLRIKNTPNLGKGVFVKEKISKDELVADWSEGKIYRAEKCSDLPKEIADHAIQFSDNEWIDVNDSRFINHSCEPNCGFKGKFQLVAMRDIIPGEQVTFDYDMSEDSDWKMECKCSSSSCRKIIGSFKNLPEKFKEKYKGYISEWLARKYL